MARGRLIGVDWGTSSLRAFLLDEQGAILERREGPDGILNVKDGDFAGVLSAVAGDWQADSRCAVVLSGMIGSRQGWLEAPYVDAPADLAGFAAALLPVDFEAVDVRIVPGVKAAEGSRLDVMRGEEVQVLGAMAELGLEGGRFVLPGTHSKWVHAKAGRITGLATYMTGEIYSAARHHTILGRTMRDDAFDGGAFEKGVCDGAAEGASGALLNRLFQVRTAALFGRFSEDALPAYLSGMLIGAEIADQRTADIGPLFIVASDTLAERYHIAAASLGMEARIIAADCVARGHMAIAKLAGLA